MIYLETSAAAKALIDEDGSDAVRALFAQPTRFVASRLLAVELHAVADRRPVSAEAVDELLDRVTLLSLGDDTLAQAIELHSGLRTLDALHLATALELGENITGLLTFDREFAAAAEAHGIRLVAA